MIRLSFVLGLMVAALLWMPAHAQRGPATVFADRVEVRPFANRIEALGTLEPRERVDLTLNTGDVVRKVYFDDGERVTQGKTLLTLAQREQIALVEAAEATEEEARRQLARIERLAADNAVSQSELDEARRNMQNATAQRRAVQSRLADRVLVAPFDGVLGFRQVSVGAYVRPGDVVATLIDDSEMRLEFSVPSIFLTQLEPGLPIDARTDDLPGRTFDGTLTSIDNAIDPVSRSVRVRATLPNPDRVLKAGMLVKVGLKADARDALAVPEKAILPRGPRFFVFVIEPQNGTLIARQREVELGLRHDGYVEVRSGLDPGARIVTEGLIRIRDGSEVTIADEGLLSPSAGGMGSVPGNGGAAASPG